MSRLRKGLREEGEVDPEDVSCVAELNRSNNSLKQ